ncbi:MAG: hypothetical protein A4E53_04468 [Pelotomaculum sp. PtaB.Bin104]|nr:MAG: hypothetical protein A4E53_04468 [Pelotomaculum sp. PtaB.Bin104]
MKDTLRMVADLMALAACTAPKTLGQDFVRAKVISGDELNALADAMDRYGKEKGAVNFDRDAENIRHSAALLLLSLDHPAPAGLNCGACGHSQCSELNTTADAEFSNPLCVWRILDLGIALGSAAKTAGLLNADNRIMGRPGTVAREMGMIKGELVIGIPISATSKNIYFDRPENKKPGLIVF